MKEGSNLLKIIFILLFFSLSCKSDPHKGQLQFYYYPEKNLYYDSVKNEFWYSLNGAKNWNAFANTNNNPPASLGPHVVIFTTKADIYKDNESHRKLYGGKLFAIKVVDTSLAATTAAPEAAERTVIEKRKVTPTKTRPADKSKNGIGKFIEKIFGKHH